ncbi:MAG TPA: hypothetical protein V6D12_06435 [Candidatus Obscuribacterales bacterium]
MSTHIIFVHPLLAQASAKKPQTAKSPTPSPPPPVEAGNSDSGQIWMFTSVGLLLILVGLAVYGKLQFDDLIKKAKFEDYKNRDMQKKLKLALDTIRKMETNPDLVHSREFNLDYLRMRMDEDVFHFSVLNQIKLRVKDIITMALRPQQATQAQIGIASTSGRQVDEMFDVMYETGDGAQRSQRVLFRIQMRLTKLPTQTTNSTINEIIECIEKFLRPGSEEDNWQPTIQGRIVIMDWDQKAKPTPLLVLEQSSEGVNVSFRTKPTKRAGVP